jgi:hypothetical protein
VLFVGIEHHIARVLVVQILEKTLYLEGYRFLDIVKLWNLAVLEVTQEPTALQ